MRHICYVSFAYDWNHVVFAMGLEPDIAQQNNFVVSFNFFKSPLKYGFGIGGIAGKELFVGAHDAIRGIHEPFPVGVIARPSDQRPNRRLRIRTLGHVAREDLLVLHLEAQAGRRRPVGQPKLHDGRQLRTRG